MCSVQLTSCNFDFLLILKIYFDFAEPEAAVMDCWAQGAVPRTVTGPRSSFTPTLTSLTGEDAECMTDRLSEKPSHRRIGYVVLG